MCTRQSHRLHGCETDENYNVARGAATQKKVFENYLLDGEIMIIVDEQYMYDLHKREICQRAIYEGRDVIGS